MRERHIYNAAIYVRLSKEDGDVSDASRAESNSISNQRELIKDFLKEKTDIRVVSERVDCVVVKDDCVILELNSESPENTGLCDVSSVF